MLEAQYDVICLLEYANPRPTRKFLVDCVRAILRKIGIRKIAPCTLESLANSVTLSKTLKSARSRPNVQRKIVLHKAKKDLAFKHCLFLKSSNFLRLTPVFLAKNLLKCKLFLALRGSRAILYNTVQIRRKCVNCNAYL